MSEQHNYSEAEHYTFPKTRADVINDELHYYQDPDELRKLTVHLAEFYEKTPIMKAMHKYAFLMNVAHVSAEKPGDESRIDRDFLLGTLLGVHSTVHGAPASFRRRVVALNPMYGIDGQDGDRMIREQIVSYMGQWDTDGFEEMFEESPEELQSALFDLTKHMYCGVYKPYEKEASFMSGYMFAACIIDSNVESGSAMIPV